MSKVCTFLPFGHARFSYGRGWWDEFWCIDPEGTGRWLSADEGDYALESPLNPDRWPRDFRLVLGATTMIGHDEFTVIGTMAWTEYHAGRMWVWVDHEIYSPTHGYAWLTVEDGFVTFARKSREVPSPDYVSKSRIETSENRPLVRLSGEKFHYYSSGRAKPTFIEGKFNFRPSMEDTIYYATFLGGERILDIVELHGEREYEITTLPDLAALMKSFGVAPGLDRS